MVKGACYDYHFSTTNCGSAFTRPITSIVFRASILPFRSSDAVCVLCCVPQTTAGFRHSPGDLRTLYEENTTMSIHYRLLHPEEEDQAVAFWMRVLESNEDEARQTFRDFHDAPQRFNQTHVAVAADGQLLATVCYWLRDVRDSAGTAVPIGHLFHVATEPSARRHGHASRLLADTIEALRGARCQWAILSARQDAVALYQRAGWQPTPRTYWRGMYALE